MTEKTARLGTTALHIQYDHEFEPGMLRIQLDNEDGTESWNQTVQRVSSALERDDARADFDFRGKDQHVRLVIGTDGGFAEVEDPEGDITEQEFTAHELSRALCETGARDPLPHEVPVPELAGDADTLAGDDRCMLVLADGSGHDFRAWLLTEVEPMEDGQNDGHLMLAFHNEGDWQGACALRPGQVRKLMALCVRALDQLTPEGAMVGPTHSEQEGTRRD